MNDSYSNSETYSDSSQPGSRGSTAGQDLLASFIVNMLIGLGLLLAFSILRPKKKEVYAANSSLPDAENYSVPPVGFFSWIPETLLCPLEWIRVHRGIDSLMYLRFLRMSFFLCLFFVVLGFIVVVPVNASGTNKDLDPSDETYVEGINIINMGNIAIGSNLFWVHSIFIFVYVAVIIIVLYREYVQYIRNYLLYRSLDEQFNRSLMVSNLKFSKELENSSIDEKESHLLNVFENLYPNEIVCVRIARQDKKLIGLRKEEKKLITSLERAEVDRMKTREEPKHKINKKFGLFEGEWVQSIPYYQQRLSEVQADIKLRKEDTRTKLTPIAFVTFKSQNSARECAQRKEITFEKKTINVELAPQPADVNWEYLSFSQEEMYIRKLFALGVIIFITFFWAIPVSFVQTLGNLRGLADTYDALAWIHDVLDFLGSAIESLINAYLPALLLVALMAMVLPILYLLANQEGRKALSIVHDLVSFRYFMFLLMNVFFVTTIAGSIISKAEEIVNGQLTIPQLLASSLPQQGDFYMNYILVKMSFVPMDILIPDVVAVQWIKKKLAKTEREKKAVHTPPKFPYAKRYAWDLLMMQITITYCMMNPMMAIFSMSYYALAYLCYKYGIIYIYKPESLSGGKLWKNTRTFILVSLYTFTLTMIGLLGLNETLAWIPVLICVILMTIGFIFMNYQFNKLEVVQPRSEDLPTSQDLSSPLLAVPKTINRIFEDSVFQKAPNGNPAIAGVFEGIDEKYYYQEPWMVPTMDQNRAELKFTTTDVIGVATSSVVENTAA